METLRETHFKSLYTKNILCIKYDLLEYYTKYLYFKMILVIQ